MYVCVCGFGVLLLSSAQSKSCTPHVECSSSKLYLSPRLIFYEAIKCLNQSFLLITSHYAVPFCLFECLVSTMHATQAYSVRQNSKKTLPTVLKFFIFDVHIDACYDLLLFDCVCLCVPVHFWVSICACLTCVTTAARHVDERSLFFKTSCCRWQRKSENESFYPSFFLLIPHHPTPSSALLEEDQQY